MGSDAVLQLGVIVVAGIGAQWLAWRLRLPAIVLLLVAGFLVGPVTGVVEPDALLGPSLPAVVSLGVGLVLFEGSLSLDLHQLREARRVIVALVTVGALVTWAAATGAATVVLELPVGLALLVGAIVVVTGPTVIGPLLAQIRPTGAVGPVLRGEGIFSDAIGATLAVLVFEAVLAGEDPGAATGTVVGGVLLTLAAGTALGLLAAALLVVVLRRFLVPDFLGSAVTIAIVLGAFTLANQIQEEAGLLTVTVTGIALATQRWVSIRPIVEFSESVGVLVVSALFIVLSAAPRLFRRRRHRRPGARVPRDSDRRDPTPGGRACVAGLPARSARARFRRGGRAARHRGRGNCLGLRATARRDRGRRGAARHLGDLPRGRGDHPGLRNRGPLASRGAWTCPSARLRGC